MAEAIFAKYSKSSGGGSFTIPPELIITNSTKSALGLGNNATLDDCLSSITLKSANCGTAKVTLKDVDGTPLGNHQIRMKDKSGLNMVYTTDGSGVCVFTTTNGQATFYDESNNGWFDVGYSNSGPIDLPLGSLKGITLQRYKTLNNGDTITLNNGSTWYNFSKHTKSGNIYLQAPDGGNSYWSPNNLYCNYWLNTYNKGENDPIEASLSGITNCTITAFGSRYGNSFVKNISTSIQTYFSQGARGKSGWANNVNLEGNFLCTIGYNGSSGFYNMFGGTNNHVLSGKDLSLIDNTPNYNTNFFLRGGNIILKSNGSTGSTSSFGNLLTVSGGSGGIHSQGSLSSYFYELQLSIQTKKYVKVNGLTYNEWLPSLIGVYPVIRSLPTIRNGWGYIYNFQYK